MKLEEYTGNDKDDKEDLKFQINQTHAGIMNMKKCWYINLQ